MKKLLFSTLFVVLFYVNSFSQKGLDVLLSPKETQSLSYDGSKQTWHINGYKVSLDSMTPPKADDWRFITNLMLLGGEESVDGLMNEDLMRAFRAEKLQGIGRDLYCIYVDAEWDDGVVFLVPEDSKKPVLAKRLKFNGVINPDK